jgi:DNA polymerase II small subunit
LLRNRQELANTASISRIKQKRGRENIAIIGLVQDKQLTKNNNIILKLEDPSGAINVLVSKSKPELMELAKEITLDEIIGVAGANGSNIVFSNKILLPEIPDKEMKTCPEESCAVFLSDLHVGSKNFLPKEFEHFLSWINGETGKAEQMELAAKTKYLFIAGDLVDGVGVYPEQDAELEVKDIYEQYRLCAEFLKRMPRRIKIVVCPGNHDATRISEPQPPLPEEFAKPVLQLPNVVAVSNPALIKIGCKNGFEGLDVLLYHGYSFDYYVANVDSIRRQGGYDKADLVMKFLLQRRHLAPSHSSTLYIPDPVRDFLVIERVPDLFVTGHIHKTAVSNYKNTTLICGSCWQSRTLFQEKVGHHPEPARVPIVNLKTRQIKILKFGA